MLPDRGATSATARALLQRGLAAFIASDAHPAQGVVLKRVRAQIEALLGAQGAAQVLVENPRRLLQGRDVTITLRQQIPNPSLLSRWFRRA